MTLRNPTNLPLPRSVCSVWATGHDVAADTSNGWRAIPGWGRNGWDLGSWPLVIVMHHDDPTGYAILTYVEGDVEVEVFATRSERDARTDKVAEFYWRLDDKDWVRGYPEGDLPDHLRGPFSWGRLT